jgi:hypothetical protein
VSVKIAHRAATAFGIAIVKIQTVYQKRQRRGNQPAQYNVNYTAGSTTDGGFRRLV